MMAAADRNNPAHLMTSTFFAASLHLGMQEYEKAEILAAQAVGLSEQHQMPDFGAQCFLGTARAQLGRAREGMALLRQGMARVLGLGLRLATSVHLACLAEAQDRAGDNLDALETIERALEANPHELIYRPEALRIRGELRAKQGATELAETDFRDAIALAQKMSAKMSELRATMSLARLLAKQGRRDEARSMLSEVYNWFTEGFDTADLKDAKALLDEFNS
jgi:tetratricopeptide (TPR) repeat protein